MKHFSFKRVLAIVLSLAVVISLIPMTISLANGSGTDASSITVSGDTVTLNLEYANTYYDKQTTGYDDTSDIRGATVKLINDALDAYNTENGTSLAMSDIDNLKVKTVGDAKLTYRFNEILVAKLPQLVELDMSEADVTEKCYAWDTSADNNIRSSYFKSLTNLEKVALPVSLVSLGSTNFQLNTKLKEIDLGDSLQSMGYGNFEGCTALTKVDLPDSLNSISSILYNFSGSGVKEFSYHGAGTGAADVAAFFTNLVGNFNQASYTKMDLSGSAIDATNALKVANKASLTYLDLSGCKKIDFTTTDGQTLKTKLDALKASGVTVKMPDDDPSLNPEGDMATIKVSGEVVTLDLYFHQTYYDTQSTGYDNPEDIRGATVNLINDALDTYNTENGASLAMSDIDNLKVRTGANAKLTYYFQDILKEKLSQLVEIDMSEASVSGQVRSWDAAGTYQDNWMRDNYFVGLSNLKKVVLPTGLVTMRFEVFQNLKNLEEVVFGDALEEIGYSAFYGCSALTKIDLPDSLCVFSSIGTQFETSGIKEFSFHGKAENATDKAAFFANLVAGFNKVNYSKIDLSNSAIDETNALALVNANKSNLTYLDLTSCTDIDFTTTDGQTLKTKLDTLKANGVTVKMPVADLPDNGDKASIAVSGDTVTLNLEYANTYYDTQSTGYENPEDIRGATLNLISAAIFAYNSENGTSLTISDIDNLKVKTGTNAKLTYYFQDILKDKLPQLVEIDMSEASVSGQIRSWDAAGSYQDNWMRQDYFAGLSNLKKVALPAGLVTMRYQAFQNLKNLEEVVFGNALEEIGYSAFYGCSKLTKLDLPDSLSKNLSYGTQFETSGIKEFSFHGKATNATDTAAFFNALVTAFNKVNYTKIDLNGSGIDATNALLVANKSTLTYIDIRNCENIDFSTTDGTLLYAKLQQLKSNGATVLMPDYTPPANPNPSVDTGDKSTITVSGDTVTLALEYNKSYYDTQSGVAYSDINDIRGLSLYLAERALAVYNQQNDTQLQISDITNLKVKTAEGVLLTARFSDFLKDKFAHLVEIDMGESKVTTCYYAWQNANDYNDDVMVRAYFGAASSTTESPFTKLKKVVLPPDIVEIEPYVFSGLKALEEVVIGDKLEIIRGESFPNTPNLKELSFPDTFYDLGSTYDLFFYGCGIEKFSFHGTAEKADDPAEFFVKLMTNINKSAYAKLDLSGSGITVQAALMIKSSVNYLDLRNCYNLEYTSEDGQELLKMLNGLIERGAEVYMPSPEELASKFPVSAKTNDKSMGLVDGTGTHDYEETPFNHKFTAKPVDGYTLIGWQVNDEETLREPGTPNEKGEFELTLEINGPTTVVGIFEIDADITLPAGNTLTVDPETGKLHLTLTISGAGNDNLISIYTQVLVKQKRQETGMNYTAADIASIKLVGIDGFRWSKNFATVLPISFYTPLKENLVKVDLSEMDITSLPAEAFSGYKALAEAILPPNLNEVTYRAFYQTVALKSIDLPDTVTIIGRESFREGGLVSISLPDTVKQIEMAAFGRNPAFEGTTGANGIFVIPNEIEKYNSDWGVVKELKFATANADTGAIFAQTAVKGIEFHGVANPASFSQMIASVNWTWAHYDFSNSSITEKQLSLIPFTAPSTYEGPRTTYLDIRGCPIDYTTPRGKALKKKLTKYIEQNPDVTILMDDGIIRDTSYTEVAAEITLGENENMADALTAWETATGGAASTITDLVIKTEGSRELAAADYTKLQEVMLLSLRKVDLSGAALAEDTIPESAFELAENLYEVKFPEDLKNIGNKAFYGTNLMSVALPETVEVIGASAFAECYSMEGELILPNGLKELGDAAFADSGITKLEYHGPVDLKLATNFTYGLSTLEYVDLRGCTAITRDNFPTSASISWESLKELNLDFCSISDPYVFFFNYFISRFSVRPNITLNCQFVPYDSVEEMLKYPIYGKQYEDYEDFDGSVIVYDQGIFGLQDVEEGDGMMSVIENILGSDDEFEDLEWSDMEDFLDEEPDETVKAPTKVKKVVTMYRRLKKGNDLTWLIWAGIGAGVLLAAAATVIIIILVKRKKSKETPMEDISSESEANE